MKKSQISVRKTKFFPRQAIQRNLFALHFLDTGDSPYQVCFTLNKSLTRQNFYFFENKKGEKVDISDWNTNFFSMKIRRTIFFVSESNYPEDTPYQVWFTLNNSLNRQNFYFFENKKGEKVNISDWNTNFSSMKVRRTIFLSQRLPTLRILHTKFGLIWIASWPDKKYLFLKFLIWKNRKFPYENLFFFLGKLYKEFFLLYTFITMVIFHTKFGSVWTTPWPDEISIFLKIEKAKKSIFPIEIRTFLLWKLGGPFFCLRGYLSWGYSIPSLVWFE